MVGILRCVTWVLCALMLSVPSASADDEDETIVSVAPGDESCSWVSVMRDPEPLFIRYNTNTACLPLIWDVVPEPGAPGVVVQGAVKVAP